MTVENLLINHTKMPNVLAKLVVEYEGRKYIKVEGASVFRWLSNIFTDSPLIPALKEMNDQDPASVRTSITKATEAIQKHGWSSAAVYPHMRWLLENNKWNAIEFIFAQLAANDPEITGYGSNAKASSRLYLGLPLIVPEHLNSWVLNEDTGFNSVPVIRKKHSNCFYKEDKALVFSESYYRIIEIWKKYQPLNVLTTYASYDGSMLLTTYIRGSTIGQMGPNANPNMVVRLMKLFFNTGLSPQSCWTSYCPDEVEQLQGEGGLNLRIHLAAWSAFEIGSKENPRSNFRIQTKETGMINAWLEAGLDPNTFVIDKYDHKVTWLMATVCADNVVGAEILLKAGANPNAVSKPFVENWHSSRLHYVTASAVHITPLDYAQQKEKPCVEMVSLLQKWSQKSKAPFVIVPGANQHKD